MTPREISVGDGRPVEMAAAPGGMAEPMSRASSFDVARNGDYDPGAADIGGGNEGVVWTEVDDRTWEGAMKVALDARAVGSVRTQITDPGKTETATVAVGPLMAAQGEGVPELETCELELASDLSRAGRTRPRRSPAGEAR